jgi:hypothetical protein
LAKPTSALVGRDAVERVSASVLARAEGRVRRGIEVALTAPEAGASGAPLPGEAAGEAAGNGVT